VITMVIPCIDLMDRKVVQLVQGKEKFLELPEPLAVLEKFATYPEIQVIDLDAAMGKAQTTRRSCASCASASPAAWAEASGARHARKR